MAKFTSSTALAHRPSIVVHMPKRSRARNLVRRAAPHVRRVGRAAGRSVPLMGLALGGLAVGYLDGKKFLDKLPKLGGSSVVTLGVAGWALTKFSKNQHLRMAGYAAIAVAAFDFGRVHGGGTSGFDDGGAGPGGGF